MSCNSGERPYARIMTLAIGNWRMPIASAVRIVNSRAARFREASSSRLAAPIPVEIVVEMPDETSMLKIPNAFVMGTKTLTEASALLPTRLPTTRPSTDTRSNLARFVRNIKGRKLRIFFRRSESSRWNRAMMPERPRPSTVD